MNADQTLDCKNLSCPLPILRTKKAMDTMSSGQVLKMIATDPGSVTDIPAWSRSTGNELVGQEHEGHEYVYYLKKK